ncbi:MAG: hypothetical protein H7Y00_06365, partial [Fimbriimonadaceae bacterium]|nr:hypothetical protein [Chitinophagales bacterium]
DGKPIIMKDDAITSTAFDELIFNTARFISIRNEEIAPTEKVEITRMSFN